ncbi:MAG: hypothetical protein Q4B82_00485 [Alysiella sp.]|uniref:hypothetical protein n=1 Tax=Alysiella sp. TaxID=1872483 RepID=UPI0026DA8A4D|nr:hypothetical protein [Alysiella sp.]MDO4433045.1 hypothetical protein [Alysiella sp.]
MRLALISFALFAPLAWAQNCGHTDSELAQHYRQMMQYGGYGENDATRFEQAYRAFSGSLKHTAAVKIGTCGFPLAQQAGIAVVHSPDRKIRAFSWNEQTGGSMHEFGNAVQFVGKNGQIGQVSLSLDRIEHIAQDTLPPHGTAYLFYDHGIAFGRLHGKSASWWRISGSRFAETKLFATQQPTHIISYEYEPHSHTKLPENFRHFVYDSKKQTLSFPVVRNTQEYEFGELTKRRIVYRYQNGRFVRQ